MTIGIFATDFSSDSLARIAWDFIRRVCKGDDRVVLSPSAVIAFDKYDIGLQGVDNVSEGSGFLTSPNEVDIIISFGGDGTFLKATHWSMNMQHPIMGVNFGHLGYLTAFGIDDMELLPEMLHNGDYEIEERCVLSVEYPSDEDLSVVEYALNEVAILKQDTASMISIPVRMDGNELACYRSDGLIVSTPTGSTAYNLSVGGPLLQPDVPALVLSPIADHSLTMRPLVIWDSSCLSLTVEGRTTSFRVSLDGSSFTLVAGTPVKISKAPFKCKVVCRKGHSFSSTLRSKLHWGENMANQ